MVINMISREDILTKLVNNIWSEDNKSAQLELLRLFNEHYRKCNYEYLGKLGAFIAFNNDYIAQQYEDYEEITNMCTGLYSTSGKCIFSNRLVIPIRGFNNKVYGFVGYDNGNNCMTDEDRIKHIPYLYMSDKYFAKDRFWLINKDEYEDAYHKGYICIVDGIFDKITLQGLGYNAVSLLGSSLTKYHRDYLRYIKNWIVFSDSDLAGNHLYEICKNYNSNTIQVKVGGAKDIDARLRSDPNASQILENLFSSLQKEHYLFNHSLEEYV